MTFTPAQALEKLLEGNRRFRQDRAEHSGRTGSRRLDLLTKQSPFATVLACGDSRVCPETLFDRGLGDLFVTRTAGHTLDSTVLGSLEFGVAGLGTPLLLVVGHQSCGAVLAAKNALETGTFPTGFQGRFVEQIIPAAASAVLTGTTEVDGIAREHTRATLTKILDLSPTIAAATAAGTTALVGAHYSFSSGGVEILDSGGIFD